MHQLFLFINVCVVAKTVHQAKFKCKYVISKLCWVSTNDANMTMMSFQRKNNVDV